MNNPFLIKFLKPGSLFDIITDDGTETFVVIDANFAQNSNRATGYIKVYRVDRNDIVKLRISLKNKQYEFHFSQRPYSFNDITFHG